MTTQLELFVSDPDESLFPYWRESLRGWLADVWMYRHNRNTTGWSMARQGLLFARCLLSHDQMSRAEFRRWWRLERRVKRWDSFANAPLERSERSGDTLGGVVGNLKGGGH